MTSARLCPALISGTAPNARDARISQIAFLTGLLSVQPVSRPISEVRPQGVEVDLVFSAYFYSPHGSKPCPHLDGPASHAGDLCRAAGVRNRAVRRSAANDKYKSSNCSSPDMSNASTFAVAYAHHIQARPESRTTAGRHALRRGLLERSAEWWPHRRPWV